VRIEMDETRIRITAFRWLQEKVDQFGNILSRDLLEKGFDFQGQRIPLVSPKGIFKPKVFRSIPLSITTTPHGPYNDTRSPDGLLLYKYRGTNPDHGDNRGLREAMEKQIPLIYFYGFEKSKYQPVWPVFIVGEDVKNHCFRVAADVAETAIANRMEDGAFIAKDIDGDLRRRYVTTQVRLRLHQTEFREIVLSAYRTQCALCRLKHPELLDAAHIIADNEPEGEPIVNNGIALCKIHHAAFDGYFLGITPDYTIEVRDDVRKETDGPMLLHGLQEMHTKTLILPERKSDWPDRKLLILKYEKYRKAC
jgi:putative restriction endonuclease